MAHSVKRLSEATRKTNEIMIMLARQQETKYVASQLFDGVVIYPMVVVEPDPMEIFIGMAEYDHDAAFERLERDLGL